MEHPTPLPQSPPVAVQSPHTQETWAEQRSFWLIFGAFGTFGLMYGVWQVILVDLSRSLQLNLGTLGAALSFGSLASLPVMMIGGRLADRVGARLILLLSAVVLGLALIGVAFTHSYLTLLAWLLLFSGTAGLYDVGLNAVSVRHEQLLGRPILTSFHASFSGFAALGALLSGGLLTLGVPFRNLYLLTAAFLVLLAVVLLRSTALPQAERQVDGGRPPSTRTTSAYRDAGVLLLAVLALLTFFNEGSLETWAALYLRDSLGVTVFVGAFGVTAIHSAMLLGRLASARGLRTVPRRTWLMGAGLSGALGVGLALASTSPVLAILGFLLAGLSYAGVLPIIFSLAGQSAPNRVGQVTSVITTIGYLGFLLGPGLIGGAAQLISLRWAFLLLATASVLIFFLARRTPIVQTETESA